MEGNFPIVLQDIAGSRALGYAAMGMRLIKSAFGGVRHSMYVENCKETERVSESGMLFALRPVPTRTT